LHASTMLRTWNGLKKVNATEEEKYIAPTMFREGERDRERAWLTPMKGRQIGIKN